MTRGIQSPVVRFGEESQAPGAWAGRRPMFVGDEPVFELSFWCGNGAHIHGMQTGFRPVGWPLHLG
ncbi:MAG: hypothetical protein QOJ19_2506 [Acidimicrobiia bacterium]|jgi:hypothetical protein|nr:hypothetical protein [Acidimicrobiia bacterium]